MSIEPPLPAVSRPSNMMTMRCLVSATQRAMALSSFAMGFRSSSYSPSLSSVCPLMPPCPQSRANVTLAGILGNHPRWNHGCIAGVLDCMPNRSKLADRALRLALTAAHRMLKLNWFLRRPRTFGAHALALTPERKVVLVKLRYAPGWRLPGGGRAWDEDPRDAVLRELREEIGLTAHGSVRLAAELDEDSDHKQDLASLL